MTFDPEEFLVVADRVLRLTDDSTSEAARCRTAASRAYYAVYGTIRAKMHQAAGYDVFLGAGKHGTLAKRLKQQHGNTPLLRSAPYFQELLDHRETSDYKYDEPMDQQTAEAAILKAQSILDRIRTLRPHRFTDIANKL